MAVESFLVTALPYSADPKRDFHVSLYFTHRLTPHGPDATLAEFPNVAQWAKLVKRATFALTGSDGADIPITPLLDPIRQSRWAKVFPPDLPVNGWKPPTVADVAWRSFPANKMDQYAKWLHLTAAYLSPVSSPSLVDQVAPFILIAGIVNGLTWPEDVLHAYAPPTVNADGQVEDKPSPKDIFKQLLINASRESAVTQHMERGDPRLKSPLHAVGAIEAMVTAGLDEVSGGGTVYQAPKGTTPLGAALYDLHLARRYYERPEEQHPYFAEPDPGYVHERPEVLRPDFHQRCTLLADTPGLLRELGLVVDIKVDDVSRLHKLDWMQAHVEVPDVDNQITVQPKVTCRVDGKSFWTVSETHDYVSGALKLGDEDRFSVLDLDPDASGLKLDRYVRAMPRMLLAAFNGDPVSGAPETLRSAGFSITRAQRADQIRARTSDAAGKDALLLEGHHEPLPTELVTRGVRLEVWDNESGTWHSLHRRLIDVKVDGTKVFDDEPDVGFLQGAAVTRVDERVSSDPTRPYHAHEALAGWEGWSLSASRPGGHDLDNATEAATSGQPYEPPPPEGPVVVDSEVEPGTLPLLRYGRRYAFRAWSVDLAGNSPPGAVVPAKDKPKPGDANTVAADLVSERAALSPLEASLAQIARDTLTRALPEVRSLRPAVDPSVPPPPVAPTGFEEVDAVARDRIDRRAARRPLVSIGREARIEQAVTRLVEETPVLLEKTTSGVEATEFARAIAEATKHGMFEAVGTEALLAHSDLITTLRPFLRWDAVLAPATLPRHPYTEGESLMTMVIRSGVELTANGVQVSSPDSYSAAVVAAHPELVWRGDSQRHLAPPKSSQLDCELHGQFDFAFGLGASSAQRKKALAWSLRESGTFLDLDVASLTTPGQRDPQPGVELHHGPTADDGDLVQLSDMTAPGWRGSGLKPGQYVVHNVDKLVLPYLPDPLVEGVALVFPDAGGFHHLPAPFATEGVNLAYAGAFPTPKPYRLVLTSGAELRGETKGNVIDIAVPPGEQLRMRVSSSLTPSALEVLGLWNSMPAAFRGNTELRDAAIEGWLWWLTPAEEMRLVHAVPRPVDRPQIMVLMPSRQAGETSAALVGSIDLHGPSTDRVDFEASWTEECIDDVAKDAPDFDVARTGAIPGATIKYEEDFVVVGKTAGQVPIGGGETLDVRPVVHKFEDTKHRRITYGVRATTRYREFFDPAVLPTLDDYSLVSEPITISIPNSARPPKPVVKDVLPLFRWDDGTEPHQPFGRRRSRRTGLRIYLDRPWHVTGDGELLAVMVGSGTDESYLKSVSQWGADPIWKQAGPALRAGLPLVDLSHLLGLDNRGEPGRPTTVARQVPLVDLPRTPTGQPAATAIGYRPEFSPDRKLWFVDVALDPGTAFWPFVRLAVARYQPESLKGLELSPIVQCDFMQLTPERTATVTRPSDHEVRVVVSGVVGERNTTLQVSQSERELLFADRRVIARVERHDPSVPTDLGWRDVSVHLLPIRGREGQVVSWGDVLALPTSVAPRRPADSDQWRVTIEEWEILPADGPVRGSVAPEGRLVYADHFPL